MASASARFPLAATLREEPSASAGSAGTAASPAKGAPAAANARAGACAGVAFTRYLPYFCASCEKRCGSVDPAAVTEAFEQQLRLEHDELSPGAPLILGSVNASFVRKRIRAVGCGPVGVAQYMHYKATAAARGFPHKRQHKANGFGVAPAAAGHDAVSLGNEASLTTMGSAEFFSAASMGNFSFGAGPLAAAAAGEAGNDNNDDDANDAAAALSEEAAAEAAARAASASECVALLHDPARQRALQLLWERLFPRGALLIVRRVLAEFFPAAYDDSSLVAAARTGPGATHPAKEHPQQQRRMSDSHRHPAAAGEADEAAAALSRFLAPVSFIVPAMTELTDAPDDDVAGGAAAGDAKLRQRARAREESLAVVEMQYQVAMHRLRWTSRGAAAAVASAGAPGVLTAGRDGACGGGGAQLPNGAAQATQQLFGAQPAYVNPLTSRIRLSEIVVEMGAEG